MSSRAFEALRAHLLEPGRPYDPHALQLCQEAYEEAIRNAEAISAANDLCKMALPQFNWGASALSANAVHILNTAPAKIAQAALGVRSK